MGYMNYIPIKDLSYVLSSLANIGFRINGTKAYWRAQNNDNVCLNIGYATGNRDVFWIDLQINNETVASADHTSLSYGYYNYDDAIDANNTIYLSDAYWKINTTMDNYVFSISQPSGAGGVIGMRINDTTFPIQTAGLYLSGEVRLSKSFIESLPNTTTYAIMWENKTIAGTVIKSDYKMTTRIYGYNKYHYDQGIFIRGHQGYDKNYLPYISLANGGIIFPNCVAFGTVNEEHTSISILTSNLYDRDAFYFIPPTDKSSKWIVGMGTKTYSCGEDSYDDISFVNQYPDPYTHTTNLPNQICINPIMDYTDGCGCITNLSFLTYKGVGSLSSFGLGNIAECDQGKYYVFKRTTRNDTSTLNHPDIYYFATKIPAILEEEEEEE